MAGIDATGFVRKTEAECKQEILDEARATVDPEYDDSPDSVTGAFAAILGNKHAELWQVLEAVWGSLSTHGSGLSLDRVARLSDTRRRAAIPTLLTVSLTGAVDGTFPAGELALSVDGDAGLTFRNRDALTVTAGAATGVFVSDVEGPVRIGAGTLGPNVDSFSELRVGRYAESDAELRARRIQELPDGGTGTVPAIRAAISKLSNVSAVRVYSNRTMSTDAEGRPAKSVEVLVIPLSTTSAALQPIADTLWANLPAGIEAYGTRDPVLTVTDEEGHQQPVGLSLATPVQLFVRIDAQVDETMFPGADAVREVITAFTQGLNTLRGDRGNEIRGDVDLGGVVYRSRISAAVLTVPGVTGVTSVTFSLYGYGWQDIDWQLGPRQYLSNLAGGRGFDAALVMVYTT